MRWRDIATTTLDDKRIIQQNSLPKVECASALSEPERKTTELCQYWALLYL